MKSNDRIQINLISVFLVFSLFSISLQAQGSESQKLPNTDPFLIKLKQTIRLFYRSIEQGDPESRIKLFTQDAIMMPNGSRFIRGIDAIAKAIRGDGDSIFKLKDITHVELRMEGNLAYTVNQYYYTYHKKGEQTNWKKTKNVHIWQRQPDGSWKLHVDIWNAGW